MVASFKMENRFNGEKYTKEFQNSSLPTSGMISKYRNKIYDQLGWNKLGNDKGTKTAVVMYFRTAHGSIFKTMEKNIFQNPLLR